MGTNQLLYKFWTAHTPHLSNAPVYVLALTPCTQCYEKSRDVFPELSETRQVLGPLRHAATFCDTMVQGIHTGQVMPLFGMGLVLRF